MASACVFTESPFTKTLPPVGFNNPQRMEMVVVFPAPLGPSRPKIEWAGMENVILSTAGVAFPLYAFIKWSTSMAALTGITGDLLAFSPFSGKFSFHIRQREGRQPSIFR